MMATSDVVVRLTDEIPYRVVRVDVPGVGGGNLRRGGKEELLLRRVPHDRIQELRRMGYSVEVTEGDDPEDLAEERYDHRLVEYAIRKKGEPV